MGGWWGLEVGKTLTYKNVRGKCMDALEEIYSMWGLLNITGL